MKILYPDLISPPSGCSAVGESLFPQSFRKPASTVGCSGVILPPRPHLATKVDRKDFHLSHCSA